VGASAQPSNVNSINPNAELERRVAAPKPAVATKKKSGGWFDWF